MSEKVRGIFSRHAKSLRHKTGEDPSSKEYSTLTQRGVEQARDTARGDLFDTIKKAPEGTVLFIGGKSDQERTGETVEVYVKELKKLESDSLKIITKEEIDRIREDLREKGRSATDVIEEIVSRVQSSPDTKFIIDYPFVIKQFSYNYNDRWSRGGEKTDYFERLVDKYNGDHAQAVHDWIENQGRLELADGTILNGPKPDIVAKEYIEGLKRIHGFASGQLPGRPLIIHGVGHQWDLDAVVTYLAKGKVNSDSFNEVTGGTAIGESEFIHDIVIDPNGQTSVRYRGHEFVLGE